MAKEIWFKCVRCGQESYCDSYFDGIRDADVMCPFCLKRMKLNEARLPTDSPSRATGLRESGK